MDLIFENGILRSLSSEFRDDGKKVFFQDVIDGAGYLRFFSKDVVAVFRDDDDLCLGEFLVDFPGRGDAVF